MTGLLKLVRSIKCYFKYGNQADYMKESLDIKNNGKCAKDKNGISGEVDTI